MRHRITITMLVIINALFPGKRQGTAAGSFSGSALPGDIPRCLANLERLVGDDGKLAFRIPGCAPLAAPFLLFRLKREGYSFCRATASSDGMLVTARR